MTVRPDLARGALALEAGAARTAGAACVPDTDAGGETLPLRAPRTAAQSASSTNRLMLTPFSTAIAIDAWSRLRRSACIFACTSRLMYWGVNPVFSRIVRRIAAPSAIAVLGGPFSGYLLA